MTRWSPWCNQHELSSPSRRDRGFRLKSADDPKLKDTRSFGSPRSPNRATSSLCHRTHDPEPPQRFRFALVGTIPSEHQGVIMGQQPSTTLGATPRSTVPYDYEQRQRGSTAHAVRYVDLTAQSTQAQAMPAPLAEHPGTTKAQNGKCEVSLFNPPNLFERDQGQVPEAPSKSPPSRTWSLHTPQRWSPPKSGVGNG